MYFSRLWVEHVSHFFPPQETNLTLEGIFNLSVRQSVSPTARQSVRSFTESFNTVLPHFHICFNHVEVPHASTQWLAR